MDDNKKNQDLQKAHVGIQKSLKNLDDIETDTIMDYEKDSCNLTSPEKWNLESISDDDSLIILSDEGVAMPNFDLDSSKPMRKTLLVLRLI